MQRGAARGEGTAGRAGAPRLWFGAHPHPTRTSSPLPHAHTWQGPLCPSPSCHTIDCETALQEHPRKHLGPPARCTPEASWHNVARNTRAASGHPAAATVPSTEPPRRKPRQHPKTTRARPWDALAATACWTQPETTSAPGATSLATHPHPDRPHTRETNVFL